jgi:hypothetical protein
MKIKLWLASIVIVIVFLYFNIVTSNNTQAKMQGRAQAKALCGNLCSFLNNGNDNVNSETVLRFLQNASVSRIPDGLVVIGSEVSDGVSIAVVFRLGCTTEMVRSIIVKSPNSGDLGYTIEEINCIPTNNHNRVAFIALHQQKQWFISPLTLRKDINITK